MKNRLLPFFLVMVLTLTWVFIAHAFSPAKPSDILAAVQKRHAGLTSLSAEYTRVTRTPAMEGVFQSSSEQRAGGILLYKKPAKLILDQATPRPEKLISDGKTVWWFIPNDNLVRQYSNVDVHAELLPLMDFLGGLGSLEGLFSVKVTPAWTGIEVNHRLDLNRLKAGTGPSGITVWFSPQDYTLNGFRLTALTGEATDFTLKNVKINPDLSDSLFQFRAPSGVKVVEESGK